MVLDTQLKLFNPDISLTPTLMRNQRLKQDTPILAEGATLVAALLAVVHTLSSYQGPADRIRVLFFGPNVKAQGLTAKALGLAPGLVQHPGGRAAIKHGALRWYTSQNSSAAGAGGAAGQQQGSDAAITAAINWAVQRLSSFAERHEKDAAAASALSSTAASGGSAPAAQSAAAAAAEAATKLCRDLAQLLRQVSRGLIKTLA
jgi:hypothetical protein